MQRLCSIVLMFGAAVAVFGPSQISPTVAAGQPKKKAAADQLSQANQIKLTVLRNNLKTATSVAETRKAVTELMNFFNEGDQDVQNAENYMEAMKTGHFAMAKLKFEDAANAYAKALELSPSSEEARQSLFLAVSGMHTDKQNDDSMKAMKALIVEIQNLSKKLEPRKEAAPVAPKGAADENMKAMKAITDALQKQSDESTKATKALTETLQKQNADSMKVIQALADGVQKQNAESTKAIQALADAVQKLQKTIDSNKVLNPK